MARYKIMVKVVDAVTEVEASSPEEAVKNVENLIISGHQAQNKPVPIFEVSVVGEIK